MLFEQVQLAGVPLTTNIDTINVTGHGVDTVVGVQQATNATWNTGDTINGNGLTKINLVANGDGGGGAAIGIVDANNIASINVNLAASTTLDSTEFTNVAQVAVTSGGSAKTLTVEQANLDTTYAINQARETTVDLNTFSNALTGTADTLNLSATGAGSKITAAGKFDLSSKAIEIVNLATSGTNYVALANAGTVEEINITGNGTNSVSIGALLATGVSVTGGSGTDTIYGAPAAGTSAATLSAVETVDVDFGAAGSYVSGVNWTGVTKVVANAASDEDVNFSGLKAEVATADIKLVHGNVQAVALGYAASSKGDLTINVGSATASEFTDLGAVTVTNLTGALTVNSKDSAQSNVIAGLTDAKATSLTVNSSAGTNFTADVATIKALEYAFNSTDGTTLDLLTNGQLALGSGATKDVALGTISLSATGVDAATGEVGSTVLLQADATNAATYAHTVDLVSITTDADGSAEFVATETGGTFEIAAIDATASAGDVVINLADLTTATEVTTGAGTADVTLTQDADTFTAGSGAVYVVTTNGADTITLGAAVDTVELTTADDNVTINSFTTGSKGDVAAVDLTTWVIVDGNSDTVLATDAVVVQNIASTATGAQTLGATTNVLNVTGVIANDAALGAFLTGLTWTSGLVDNDDILVTYYNGANTVVTTVNFEATGSVFSVNNDGATLVGTSSTGLVAANFDFVA